MSDANTHPDHSPGDSSDAASKEVPIPSSILSSDDVDGDSDFESDSSDRGLQAIEVTVVTEELGIDGIPTNLPNVVQLTDFAEAKLHPRLAEAVVKMGWTRPTPVQGLCLPYSLTGRDVAGFAQTGTGKTGVFLITAAQRLLQAEIAKPRKAPSQETASEGAAPEEAQGEGLEASTSVSDESGAEQGHKRGHKKSSHLSAPKCIVLAPTRELAVQIDQDAEKLFAMLGINSMAIYGGVEYDKQLRKLREGVDVIVATPGRLKDFYQKQVITLDECRVFVCDEADRMFDMGFIDDVNFFLDKLPEQTQKLLFSATTNPEVKELAFEYLNKPAYISVAPDSITPDTIEQTAVICDAPNKLKVILGLLKDNNPDCAIIFTNTKLTAEWLHYKLVHNGIDADLITGDLPQQKRINLIQKIKEGKIKALIATDVASRGLHISRVTHVYNFDLPDEPANYVHRIGRTARAGARGNAISLVCDDYGHNLSDIKSLLGDKIPLRAQWFDSRYLAIEDKAGNPFKDPNGIRRGGMAARDNSKFKDRDMEQNRDRGGSSGRRPRSGGPKDGQSARGGGRGEADSAHRQGGRNQGRGGRDEQRDSRPTSGQGGHKAGDRGTKTKAPAYPHKPAASGHASGIHKTQGEAPRTFMGLVKKLFKAVFGGK